MTINDLAELNSEGSLHLTGVLTKGYGIAPKIIAIDRSIPLAAKGCYGYFASFCGGGNTAWPSRDLIVADLDIVTTTYYKLYKVLKNSGLISVKMNDANDGVFKNNIYILENKPSCYADPSQYPEDLNEKEISAYCKAGMLGINACGYGVVAKSVMTDRSLSLGAKGVYFYMCAFSGRDFFCTPDQQTMAWHLGVSRQSLGKHIDELLAHNYIKKERLREGGKLLGWKYFLVIDPEEEVTEVSPDVLFSDGAPSETPVLRKPHTEESHTVKPHTVKSHTNNNKRNNNNFNNNNPSIPMTDRWMEVVKSFDKNGVFPYWLLKEDPSFCEYAVSEMINKTIFMDKLDEFDKDAVETAKDIILEIFISSGSLPVNGVLMPASILVKNICKKIKKYSSDPYLGLGSLVLDAARVLKKTAEETRIKNPKSYLRTIIYNLASSGDLEVNTAITYEFGPETGRETAEG